MSAEVGHPRGVPVTCEACGVEFVSKSFVDKFCTIDCRERHYTEIRHAATPPPGDNLLTCKNCDAEFYAATTGKNPFCSLECRREWQAWQKRDRRQSDPEFREAERIYSNEYNRLRYNSTASVRAQKAERQRYKLQNDPVFRQQQSERTNAYRRGLASPDRETLEYFPVVRGDPCSYCAEDGGEADHIDPVSAGGDNHWSNLTGACRGCNASKHNRTDLLVWMMERKTTLEARRESEEVA